MHDDQIVVIGGIDAHADTHQAAALDHRGALLGTRSFVTTFAGYSELVAWLRGFGHVEAVAVASTGAYAAGLTRYLREHDVAVIEVNQPHAHTRRRRGKSDPIDAETAARLVLARKATTVPKQTDGIVESIRLLRVARASAVKARSAALVQLGEPIITVPQELREQLARRKTIRGKAGLCQRLRPDAAGLDRPLQAAKLALRSLARRIEVLDAEIGALDRQLEPLVGTAAPRTTQLLGISTGHAGQLLVTAGQNIDRLHGDGAFAAICGASPPPASSGRTTRHRLNHCGGDRAANRALHMIAVCRLRYCDRTRAYAERRAAEGRPSPRSSAASSAPSPARPTAPFKPTSPISTPAHPATPSPSPAAPASWAAPAGMSLDIYRNVRGNSKGLCLSTWRAGSPGGPPPRGRRRRCVVLTVDQHPSHTREAVERFAHALAVAPGIDAALPIRM